jgi:hypothetical protein
MKTLLAILALALLAGCAAPVAKVESGEKEIGPRLVVHLEGAWNHMTGAGPAQTWTMEGLPVDQLLIYSGVKDGEAVHRTSGPGARGTTFSFRSSMQPDEIVSMFEGMLTRDGSSFKLARLEPMSFGGEKGLRFEYALTRKVDNAQLSGVGYAAVSKGELFAILYMAPRLTFFSRHKERVEAMARSARLKI